MASPTGPPDLVAIRVLTVHNGHTVYPVLCRANLEVIEILHKQTGKIVSVPWEQMLDEIGRFMGLNREQVLQNLGSDPHIPVEPPVTIGLSAASSSEDRGEPPQN